MPGEVRGDLVGLTGNLALRQHSDRTWVAAERARVRSALSADRAPRTVLLFTAGHRNPAPRRGAARSTRQAIRSLPRSAAVTAPGQGPPTRVSSNSRSAPAAHCAEARIAGLLGRNRHRRSVSDTRRSRPREVRCDQRR